MDDRKSDNEKIIKYIGGKLKDGEMILVLQNIILYGKSNNQQAKLVITTTSVYFLQGTSIKKYFKATGIDCVILTPFCYQMVIYYDPKGDQSSKQSVRFQSHSNVKIIQHFIIVREKFNQVKDKLCIMICPNKNLQSVANVNQNVGKTRLFGFLFKKKQDALDLQHRLSGEGQLFTVSYKDFAIEIGQRMYNQIYKNIKLLYINSNQTFRFYQEKFDVQQINSIKKLFRPRIQQAGTPKLKSQSSSVNLQPDSNKNVMMRKIGKKSTEDDKRLTDHLRAYQNQQYKQELLYALQTETHFQLYTSMFEGQRDCQQLLNDHQFLSEKDLRSIFFKLIQMIENTHEIFYSLSPQNIIVGNYGIRISEVFCCLPRRAEIDYIAPQQLTKQTFSDYQIQLINFWKTGILIFELAYGNVPFPTQYIVSSFMMKQKQLQLNFPSYSLRTQQFQYFIRSILRVQPTKRGIQNQNLSNGIEKQNKDKNNWRQNIMKNIWLKYK